MQRRLSLALLLGVLVAPFSARAQIYNFWGPGNIRAGVTTGQTTSTSKEQTTSVTKSFTGSAYTVTGENVLSSGPLGPGQTYNIGTPGAPFQFSETWMEGGMNSITKGGRSIETKTLSNTLSVFSEIGSN